MLRVHTIGAAAALGAAAIALPTRGQCEPETFEGFATGTVITTQIPGVVVSTDESCGGGAPKPVIVVPGGGTASGTKALSLQTGCPDFSPDALYLDFDDPQRMVSFCVGESTGFAGATIDVRAYNSAGGLVSSQSISTAGGTRALVVLGSPAGPANIATVRIRNPIDLFETIDDLQFDQDFTPPTAQIDEPDFITCVCDFVTVRGIACDPDGVYGFDRLDYRAVSAAPSDPWVEVGTYNTPVCTSGTLYTWDATGVPEGHYYLRLTVENACGMTSTDVTVVRVDRSAPYVALSRPLDGSLICGDVEIRGISNDYDACDGSWKVEIAPKGTGSWSLLAEGSGDVSCVIAVWDTTGVADGDYDIRLAGMNVCGLEATDMVSVTVDNASGCGCSADINGDGVVNVEDLLILLAGWTT